MANFGSVIPVTGVGLGFLGNPSRLGERVVVAKQANAANAQNIVFGDAVVVIPDSTGGTLRNVLDFITQGGTLTAAVFAGVALREVKTNLVYQTLTTLGTPQTGYYAPGEMAEYMTRGSLTVACYAGTPVVEGPVYVRTVANVGTYPNSVVGGFEAVSDAGKNILIPGLTWKTGVLDANFICELTILNRLSA